MVKNLGPDQAIYLADIRSIEWCIETFGEEQAGRLEPSKDLSIISMQLLDRGIPINGMNLRDLLPLIHGGQDKDDPDMVVVLTRYQPRSRKFPKGHRAFFVPDQLVLDRDDNPYPEVPCIDYHWAAPGSTFWTPGFIRDMHALSKFINKRWSQLGEASNAQLYEILLLGEGLSSKDVPTDFPGVMKNAIDAETGMPKVQTLSRGGIPTFHLESTKIAMETLDMVGGSDLMSQRKFPGQLRGSLTIPMLQEIIDSEDGPRFAHLAEQFSLEKMMRINRVKEFYPPVRTLAYTGEDQRSEVLEFHNDELLKAGVDFTVTVDPGSIMPELSAMREARVRELFQWAPGIYTNPRTGTVDWSAIANDLKYNYKQRESIATQGRKLARQLIQWARRGKITAVDAPGQPNPETGQPGPPTVRLMLDTGQPLVILPFWAHDAMMDEYEAVMQTTEFIEATPAYVRVMLTLREKHREILAQMDAARQSSIENKMIQSTLAQVSQQTAAKVASTTADAVMEQILMTREGAEGGDVFGDMNGMMRQLMGGASAAGQNAMPVGAGASPEAMLQRRRLRPQR